LENNRELAEDLARSLQATTSLMQSLLGEIRDNATTLAVLKEKLESLSEKVENLNYTVKSGNGKGSLITRLALVENDLKDLDKTLAEYKEEVEKEVEWLRGEKTNIEEFNRQKTLSMWKVAAVAVPGLVALIIQVIKLLTAEG